MHSISCENFVTVMFTVEINFVSFLPNDYTYFSLDFSFDSSSVLRFEEPTI